MENTEPKPIIDALTYVKNTNGGATAVNFMEDHNPMGAFLWKQLLEKSYVGVNIMDRIILTTAGEEILSK